MVALGANQWHRSCSKVPHGKSPDGHQAKVQQQEMMAIVFLVLTALAVFHFVWDGILAPSFRRQPPDF